MFTLHLPHTPHSIHTAPHSMLVGSDDSTFFGFLPTCHMLTGGYHSQANLKPSEPHNSIHTHAPLHTEEHTCLPTRAGGCGSGRKRLTEACFCGYAITCHCAGSACTSRLGRLRYLAIVCWYCVLLMEDRWPTPHPPSAPTPRLTTSLTSHHPAPHHPLPHHTHHHAFSSGGRLRTANHTRTTNMVAVACCLRTS